MLKFIYFFVLFCVTINLISADFSFDDDIISRSTTTTHISSSTEVKPLPYDQDVIYRHLASVLMKRTSNPKAIPNSPQLSTAIVAQIKARIYTEITSKISASIFQKVKTNLSIKASVMGGTVKVDNAQIEAIQTAVVDGLQTKISQTVEKKFNKVISQSVGPKIDKLLLSSTSQKVLTNTQLTKVLMQAETIVRQEIHVTLPEIQKTLKTSVNTQLKAHIKDLEVDIPGVLKIEVSAKIDVVSSVKTVVTSIYKSYADVSIAVVVKSYIKGIQKALKA